jgi:hypothetical protein
MHIFYVDDSKDEKLAIFSAIAIPGDQWKACFRSVKAFRQDIKQEHGIPLHTEMHATDFVAGRGSLGSKQVVYKGTRCNIFKSALQLVAALPGVSIINVCGPRSKEDTAFEYLLNRVNTAMIRASSHAIVISDKGKEGEYTRLARKMAVYNPIPSKYGSWSNGKSKNIPIEQILEDIVFKDSRSSYFVQLADFCAYSLLRREHQLPSKNKYGVHEAFDLLSGVLNRNASPKDKDGIVRT